MTNGGKVLRAGRREVNPSDAQNIAGQVTGRKHQKQKQGEEKATSLGGNRTQLARAQVANVCLWQAGPGGGPEGQGSRVLPGGAGSTAGGFESSAPVAGAAAGAAALSWWGSSGSMVEGCSRWEGGWEGGSCLV
jgi:hypothetical protein